MLQAIDSIIFDLDGTLWDPTEMCVTAWNTVIEGHPHINPIDEKKLKSVFGMKFDLIGAKLFPELSINEQEKLMEDCMKAEEDYILKHGAILYHNLTEVLTILARKFKLYIVSNCQAGYIEAFLDYYQLHHLFCDIECAGNTMCNKGENIKLIMKRNQLTKPVYVGDTNGDYLATIESGVPFIFADYGFGKVDNAKYTVHSVNELLDLLV
ncbi:MAG: HAD family hydrolase [Turicibacter sp.]